MDDEREPDAPGPGRELREAAAAYRVERPGLRIVEGAGANRPDTEHEERRTKVKTSVYLEQSDVRHLAWLSEVEQRPQAEIIRDAIRQYQWTPRDRNWRLFELDIEGDGRSIADIPEEELMAGFGEDAWSDTEEPIGHDHR